MVFECVISDVAVCTVVDWKNGWIENQFHLISLVLVCGRKKGKVRWMETDSMQFMHFCIQDFKTTIKTSSDSGLTNQEKNKKLKW